MSVQAEVQDLEALNEAVSHVRSDTDGLHRKSWVLVGHVDNNPNQIKLIAQDTSGEANLDEFAAQLAEDQVMYGFIRVSTSVDMNTTVKFLYIHWHGEKVPFVRKGRFGVVHGSIVEHFQPFHAQIETGNKEELSEDEIIKKLDEGSFSTNRILSPDELEGRQYRGFTQHQISRTTKVTGNGNVKHMTPSGGDVEIAPELNEAIGNIRDDKQADTWITAAFEDGNPKKALVVVGKGDGDIDELKDHLQDDQVQYSLYRTSDVIDAITTVKFVYIYWVGSEVKALTKGKVAPYVGAVEKVFSPVHVTLTFNHKDEITESVIKDKVTSSSGSKSFVKT